VNVAFHTKRHRAEVAGAVWAQTCRLKPELLTEDLAAELTQRLTAGMLPPVRSADFPKREAAFGRGLGLMAMPDGRPLDRRPGCAGSYDAQQRQAQVDIDWVRIPAGPFVYQGKPARIDATSSSAATPSRTASSRPLLTTPRAGHKRSGVKAPHLTSSPRVVAPLSVLQQPVHQCQLVGCACFLPVAQPSARPGHCLADRTPTGTCRCRCGRVGTSLGWGVVKLEGEC